MSINEEKLQIWCNQVEKRLDRLEEERERSKPELYGAKVRCSHCGRDFVLGMPMNIPKFEIPKEGKKRGKSKGLRYSVEVWIYHNMVDSHKCASLNEAREWLRKGGWIKSWAYGNCSFDVFKDGKEVSFDTLYENKFYDEEEE